ncbi:a0dff3bf-ce28-4154-a574-b1657f33762b [Thermothielavioides terrestris]|uniref:A0dff3bf-ce28-4154-a574-b1657f33762b n=1 Tax=Thermothielavioides terrestris TaxID=2587410 RepID=A0A446BP11_9PEZI|nr:a0dff3bf-ce28-4154-a574-b1657f33762b [Thermothielavioides terrestris]
MGRPRPPIDGPTTLALDKRQETNGFITLSTVYKDGDASRPRTAESGYDIRVDVANSAWGFCGSNNPNQCDMAGTCVDSFSCSRGCGFGNTYLDTWTCSDSSNRYCSTALLTLSSDTTRAVTYLACADKPGRTEEFMAFTTTTPASSSSSSSTTPPQASQTMITSTQSVPTTTSVADTGSPNAPSPSSSADPANNSSSSSSNNNNNTGMIVGASVGCVALVCVSVVIVFLIRRNRTASGAAPAV